MNDLLIYPTIVLLATACLSLILAHTRNMQLGLALVGSSGAVLSSFFIFLNVLQRGTMVMTVGNWPIPFGISFVADRFSAVMLLISNILGLCCIFYSAFEVDMKKIQYGFFSAMLVLLTGINGALLTGDLFNLYVWFEVILISSFGLLTIGSTKAQIKGALPYVAINLFASCLFLTAIGALYGVTGSLNMAELALGVRKLESPMLLSTVSILFLLSFGIKAAIFPLFFWLPVSYHTPTVTVSAIFAGLLTKIAVYSMIRVFTVILVKDADFIHHLLLFVASATMIVGVIGAAAQTEIRKILSFHIISQIGYMLMGLAFFTPLALGGTVLFIIHNILIKSNLFLISGAVFHLTGSFEIKQHGGLYRHHAFLSLLFILSAFSLAGLPPLSGFWGKLILVSSGLEKRHYFVVGVALGVSLLTLYSMTKIWLNTFWKPSPENLEQSNKTITGHLIPIAFLTALALLPVVYPEPILLFFTKTGLDLSDTSSYIQAVLSVGGRE